MPFAASLSLLIALATPQGPVDPLTQGAIEQSRAAAAAAASQPASTRRRSRGGVKGSQGRAFREASASVSVDGTRLPGAAIVVRGRVLVEMRPVFEALGARVDYDARTRKINAFTPARGIEMTIGERMASMPGSTMLDVAPFLRENRVFVPLSAVTQAFGASVKWDPRARIALVTSGSGARNGVGSGDGGAGAGAPGRGSTGGNSTGGGR